MANALGASQTSKKPKPGKFVYRCYVVSQKGQILSVHYDIFFSATEVFLAHTGAIQIRLLLLLSLLLLLLLDTV